MSPLHVASNLDPVQQFQSSAQRTEHYSTESHGDTEMEPNPNSKISGWLFLMGDVVTSLSRKQSAVHKNSWVKTTLHSSTNINDVAE